MLHLRHRLLLLFGSLGSDEWWVGWDGDKEFTFRSLPRSVPAKFEVSTKLPNGRSKELTLCIVCQRLGSYEFMIRRRAGYD